MGTLTEWAKVAIEGIAWGGLMLFFMAPYRKRKGYRPLTSWEDILGWGLAGITFGILVTFGWERAFHAPLVFLTVGTMLASLILERIRRRKHASHERP